MRVDKVHLSLYASFSSWVRRWIYLLHKRQKWLLFSPFTIFVDVRGYMTVFIEYVSALAFNWLAKYCLIHSICFSYAVLLWCPCFCFHGFIEIFIYLDQQRLIILRLEFLLPDNWDNGHLMSCQCLDIAAVVYNIFGQLLADLKTNDA